MSMHKYKECLKHYYLERVNQKNHTKWPDLGDYTFYVEVTLVKAISLSKRFIEGYASNATGLNNTDHLYITVNQLLKDGYKTVSLIEGDPGAGKTTFTFQICKEWAEDNLLLEDIVFWIPLRHYKSVTSVSELFSKLGCPAEIVSYAQQNYGKGLVLILDGWDEIPNCLEATSLFHDIIFGTINTFTFSTIIVTSRPAGSGDIAKAVEKKNCYYQILGFDWQMAVTYINDYFHNDPPLAKLLLNLLVNNKYLYQHFYMPISVAIMCFVYSSDGEQIPRTLSRLYERYVVLCLRSNVPGISLQDLAEFTTIHSIPEKARSLFHKLCKIAFDMLKDKRLVLNKEELQGIQVDLDNLQLKQFDGFGLLHVDHYTSKEATIEISYSFIHRAVQELLSAIFILNTESNNISDILNKFFYKDSYLLNIFPFLFGLVSKDLLRPLTGKIIQIFNKSNRNDKLVSSILYCLFEAHDETLCREFGRVFSEKADINLHLNTLLDCYYACYFIAVCGTKRFNISTACTSYMLSADSYCETIANSKYLQNTSNILSFHFYNVGDTSRLSYNGMKQFAKTLSTQCNILSVELRAKLDLGCVSILCDSIRKHNCQITNLKLSYGEMSATDLENVGLLLNTCVFLESLHINCSPIKEMYLDLSQFFCRALCETKSLQKLVLFWWRLSLADSKVFGNIISQNCSLKELCINVATADCLGPILNGLSSNTSITKFRSHPSKICASNTLEQCLERCITLNRSLNIIDFTVKSSTLSRPLYISWSPTQVSSICTGLCFNTTVVTLLDISGCYVDSEACNAVCGMLPQNTTLQHLFLNPVHLEKQEAIAMIDSCRANGTLELLSLVQWPPKTDVNKQGKNSFQYSCDLEIILVLLKIRKFRQESPLNVHWLVAIYIYSYIALILLYALCM